MRCTRILRHEQDRIRRGLDVAEAVCDQLRHGRAVEPQVLDRLFDLLRNYASRYHQARLHAALIPWVERKVGAQRSRFAAWMRREREAAKAHLKAASRAAEQLPLARREFLEHLTAYVWMTRWQTNMADNALLPLVERLGEVDEDVLDQLLDAVPDADWIEAKYAGILRALEEDVGVLGMPDATLDQDAA